MNAAMDFDDLPESEMTGSEAIERLIREVRADGSAHPVAVFFLRKALATQRAHEAREKGGK